FMAVGAFMAYNFELRIPGMPILVSFALGGLCAAAVGIVFGLPSLRIKGFYLAVATLACQFFVLWALQRFGWFSNNSTSGVITAGRIEIVGYEFASAGSKYVLTLGGVAGALYAFCYLGTVEPEAFNLDLSFRILFMIIIGGVGSILGSFLGAAFI